MSSKRKWDQAADDESTASASAGSPSKAPRTDGTDPKSSSDAAAVAAAIAAKIAAQFASGGSGGGSGSGAGIGGGIGGASKDPHDPEFTHDIDINDVRNRYMLTKGGTQTQVRVFSLPSHLPRATQRQTN
jgi:hypothetical protein